MNSKPEVSLEALYESALQIRAFENLALRLFDQGLIQGTTHTCIGQEANAVAVAAAAGPDSVIVSNHRGHGHFLAATQDYEGLLFEMAGLPEGVCGGWGGSQHLCCPGRFYSNGILGSTAAMAVGLALAKKRKAENGIVRALSW